MTLRARLACALGLVGIILVSSVVAILGLVRSSLIGEIDRQLRSSARVAAGPLPSGPTRPPSDTRALPPAGTAPETSAFTEMFIGEFQKSGAFTIRLQGSEVRAIPAVTYADARAHATGLVNLRPFQTESARGTDSYRALVVRTSDARLVLIALSTHHADETYGRVRLGVIAVAAVLLVALLLAGWWVVRLGIRPIKHVTDAAIAITDGDLERRVEPQPHGTEAGRLADAFNIMAERRAISEQQLRQFVADASHELRTPLTTITGVLTLYRTGALESRPVLDEALRRALQESQRMTSLVNDLLLLASLDQGAPIDNDTVDLGELVADAAFDAAILDADRTIVTHIGADVRVTGDEPRLRQVVGNLVANAVAYTPPNSSIALDVKAAGDECVLEVRDHGPGMTQEQAARVFDRFYRIDAGRSRVRGGTGLGLSIVSSIVAAHHGTVSITTAPGRGTAFRVVLPRTHAPQVEAEPEGAPPNSPKPEVQNPLLSG